MRSRDSRPAWPLAASWPVSVSSQASVRLRSGRSRPSSRSTPSARPSCRPVSLRVGDDARGERQRHGQRQANGQVRFHRGDLRPHTGPERKSARTVCGLNQVCLERTPRTQRLTYEPGSSDVLSATELEMPLRECPPGPGLQVSLEGYGSVCVTELDGHQDSPRAMLSRVR